jgi:hypothetical protein
MGTVRIDLEHNVEDVIEDIETEVKQELERLPGAVEAVLDLVRADARRYVKQDAELSGQLRQAIRLRKRRVEENRWRLTVGVGNNMADYAAIVELGTGDNTLTTTEKAPSKDVPNREMDRPPADFPFNSPNIRPEKDNPTFLAFAGHIEDWMREKGIKPEKGSYAESSFAIAHEIIMNGNYAHPYLRPAWFERELDVRQTARSVVREATR